MASLKHIQAAGATTKLILIWEDLWELTRKVFKSSSWSQPATTRVTEHRPVMDLGSPSRAGILGSKSWANSTHHIISVWPTSSNKGISRCLLIWAWCSPSPDDQKYMETSSIYIPFDDYNWEALCPNRTRGNGCDVGMSKIQRLHTCTEVSDRVRP